MDLQTILNASDSSEGEFDHQLLEAESGTIDLEDILREDDDDDEEDAFHIPQEDDDWKRFTAAASPRSTTDSPSRVTHNPDDWAILQHILNQEDEDDEDDDDWIAANTSALFPRGDPRKSGLDVDSIVGSFDEEEDEDETLTAERVIAALDSRVSASIAANGALDRSLFTEPHISPQSSNRPLDSSLLETSASKEAARDMDRERSEMDEVLYRKSIAYAQSMERKLMKSGHREIVSPLMVKRRLRPKIELHARTEGSNNNKTRAPRGHGISSLVENKSMQSISASLDKHAKVGMTKVHCGLPTCLAFNSKFIAVGTQKGVILIYDLFEVLRQRLGGTEEVVQDAGAITSLGLAYNGEAVLAGYANGTLLLWDTIRGVILRNISDVHASTITSVQFLGDLNCVTVDAGGLVSKLSFTKNMLWANYSMETECLLDGTAGQILALSVLAPYASVKPSARPESYSKALRGLSLIALSSSRSSFAVAVEPKVSVLHRWTKPPIEKTRVLDEEEESAREDFLPCLSWGWALSSGGGSVVMPVLARSWGCCLQLLLSSFPTMDSDGPNIRIGEEPVVHWPAFGVNKEIDTSIPVIALDWLNDHSLVFLNANSELILVDTVMMTLLECLDFSSLNFVYAEFSLSRSANDSSERKSCMTFQNSVKYSDDRIMILCQSELRCISIVGARRRISTLEADGEWLEALAFALDHYENTVLSQEDRRRGPDGSKRELSRHPEFSVAKSEDEEWIAKLLVRYMSLAVENAPETACDRSTVYSSSDASGRLDLALSHYQMLAGVCVDYCVLIRRVDLLFGPIFRQFQSVGYVSVFLDVLEPYILNEKLSYIAPEVMGLFVEHCKATTSIATVERCLLHMDCTIMDFDSILQLLRANNMFTALFYVFNNGLDDYVSPLEILLERVFNEADAGGVPIERRADGVLQTDFERLGYKAIIYLQACFDGKSFPQGKQIEPDDKVSSIKLDLMKFLFQPSFKPSAHARKSVNSLPDIGQRSVKFPYLRLLLLVDPRGMLETLSLSMDSYGGLRFATTASGSTEDWINGGHEMRPSTVDIQGIVLNLAAIFIPENVVDQSLVESKLYHARGAVDTFLEFAAKYIIDGSVRVNREITLKIIMRFATQYTKADDGESRSTFQRKVMDVLSALPRDAYDPDLVLQIFKDTHMHRAALLLHQQVASAWSGHDNGDFEMRSSHFISAIDSFVGDDDPEFRFGVFTYVKKECSATEQGENETLRDSLLLRMSTLVNLDAVQTARLTAELFVDDIDKVISSLDSESDRGESLFLFFNAIVSGDLAAADTAAASVITLTMDHHHRYLTLLAKLHPNLVYDYLATHDNYRPEDCLILCQEHDIADASAYLLERTGNVAAALQLILQTLETRMMGLKRTIRGLGIETIRSQSMHSFGRSKRNNITLPSRQEAEIDNVRRILTVALDVCERNSGNFAISRSGDAAKFSRGDLWFNVLDRLINAKGFLRLTKEQPEHADIMANVLSELLRSTMQRMVSSVPLSDIVRKVTSDNSGSRIGELREMVEGLLAAYNFELNVFQGASTVFQEDLRNMRKEQVNASNEGESVSIVMDTPLEANRHDITTKLLQHPLYQRGMMQISGPNRAIFTVNEGRSTQQAESSLVQGVRKLRRRRHANRKSSSRSLGISMMTATERSYEAKELEPVLYAERLVGILGEAENRGRMISF